MSFEVAVVGAPFLDLTFEGLGHIPAVGEEVVGRALHVGPGGTGMQAIGASRLGLSTALVAPLGESRPAELLKEMLAADGVTLVGDHAGSEGIPVTALLTSGEGVAMASVIEGAEPTAEEVASAKPDAVVVSLGRLGLAPGEASLYACTGGLELGNVSDETMSALGAARVFTLNAAEAAILTGKTDPEASARELVRLVPTAVVTMGAEGAFAAEGDRVLSAPAPTVEVVDATGAGDLFVAAYLWADLHGATLQERLSWASLYAGLSTRAPTAFAGALGLDELLAEGRDRGLGPPPHL